LQTQETVLQRQATFLPRWRVRNLREVAPLFYSNVPKGYEELIPWLRRDRALRENFFSRVRILQYSGASLAQHVCDAFDELARNTIELCRANGSCSLARITGSRAAPPKGTPRGMRRCIPRLRNG
jgi:hypothetical protein